MTFLHLCSFPQQKLHEICLEFQSSVTASKRGLILAKIIMLKKVFQNKFKIKFFSLQSAAMSYSVRKRSPPRRRPKSRWWQWPQAARQGRSGRLGKSGSEEDQEGKGDHLHKEGLKEDAEALSPQPEGDHELRDKAVLGHNSHSSLGKGTRET